MRSDWLHQSLRFPRASQSTCASTVGRLTKDEAKIALAVLDCAIRTIYDNRVQLNLGAYFVMLLRDVALRTPDTVENPFSFFGIMTADYQRKVAFETYRELIASLGT